MTTIDSTFFEKDSVSVAKEILGMKLTMHGGALIITETEAYLGEEDKASHARFGRSKRSSILYEGGGIIYVYMIYGIHLMLNIVTGAKDHPSAVLIRNGKTLDNTFIKGPGNVAKYLHVTKEDNGKKINETPDIQLTCEETPLSIYEGTRIGIAYAGEWKDKLLRFWI